MNFLKRLFGPGSTPEDNAIHLYVRCERCGTPVHVRIDRRNDLMPEYGDDDEASGYRLVKEIMDSRCFRLMRAEIEYDRARREKSRTLEGGTFITKAEYEQLVGQGMNERPLWSDGQTFPAEPPDQLLPEQADAVVIGGGICGLAAARQLARIGADTVLLEAHTPGWGASSRNGGMVLSGLKLGVGELIERYGLEHARRMFAASLAAIDCVEQLVREEQIECSFTRHGHLTLAAKPAHVGGLVEETALLKRHFGHTTHLVARGELHAEIGSSTYFGGQIDPTSAGLDPARYVAGLARAAQAAGASLHGNTTVKRISRESPGFRIATTRGSLRASQVFVASGGYTGAATPALQRKLVPLGSYVIATEPLPVELASSLSPTGRMMFDTRHFLYYFRLTPDQRMLFGGRAGFLPATPATVRRSAEILRRGMIGVYPQLRDAQVAYAWGGTLDVAFDMMPHAGQRDGLHFALGYAGHGVALATYMGTQVARQLAGAGGDNPFDGIPFPGAPLGLYDGRPWFLPLAGAYYKVLDWVS